MARLAFVKEERKERRGEERKMEEEEVLCGEMRGHGIGKEGIGKEIGRRRVLNPTSS